MFKQANTIQYTNKNNKSKYGVGKLFAIKKIIANIVIKEIKSEAFTFIMSIIYG